WRADFAEWRHKRIWQENYQEAALQEVRRVAGAVLQDPPAASAKPRLRVLDLGAGMGGFAVAMRRTGAAILALDYNFSYCEITRSRARRYSLDLPALVGAGEAL